MKKPNWISVHLGPPFPPAIVSQTDRIHIDVTSLPRARRKEVREAFPDRQGEIVRRLGRTYYSAELCRDLFPPDHVEKFDRLVRRYEDEAKAKRAKQFFASRRRSR